LSEAGYPFDLSFEQPPPPVLRSFVETVWMDRDRVVEPDERISYLQCVAEWPVNLCGPPAPRCDRPPTPSAE